MHSFPVRRVQEMFDRDIGYDSLKDSHHRKIDRKNLVLIFAKNLPLDGTFFIMLYFII